MSIDSYLLTKQEIRFAKRLVRNQYTMLGVQSLLATTQAAKYVSTQKIPGAFVECGVWRGGCTFAALNVFRNQSDPRDVAMYDTFKGMTEPKDNDIRLSNNEPAEYNFKSKQREGYVDWCFSSLGDVQDSFDTFEFSKENVTFVEGDILETLRIEKNLPSKIALLRLDTDWYESTKLELEILYPLLQTGGIIIVDDYGAWAGSRQAVNEYFADNGNAPYFQSTKNGGIIGVKVA